MRQRRLNSESGVAALLQQPPLLHFTGRSRRDWHTWQRRFKTELIRLLGRRPPKVRSQPQILEHVQCDGYIREKVVFDTDSFSSIVAYVLVPNNRERKERRPAILCAHGHGK